MSTSRIPRNSPIASMIVLKFARRSTTIALLRCTHLLGTWTSCEGWFGKSGLVNLGPTELNDLLFVTLHNFNARTVKPVETTLSTLARSKSMLAITLPDLK
ncbi:hypothetical protein N7532_001101 [Penicillium argentinense]|uniref:Uncharacterized protein n=1 Tax=Penicillium argentinense TaxID=1131581 RepID=A0A9W9KM36_9EURO|nr:uncharacterized protein N7532_001101 [Penicillium argentinense]KAJ5110566.1 hypothetical protein N7532_001101 [Penicillium argentinense]